MTAPISLFKHLYHPPPAEPLATIPKPQSLIESIFGLPSFQVQRCAKRTAADLKQRCLRRAASSPLVRAAAQLKLRALMKRRRGVVPVIEPGRLLHSPPRCRARVCAQIVLAARRRRVDTTTAAFVHTAWDRPFREIVAGAFYRDAVRPEVVRQIEHARWLPAFQQRVMAFAEAGARHRDFVQLNLVGPTDEEQQAACHGVFKCTACGRAEYSTAVAMVAEQQTGTKRPRKERWRICDDCFPTFDRVMQTHSALWAITPPEGDWPRQGYAVYKTPRLHFGSQTPAHARDACRAILQLLAWGDAAAIWSPMLYPADQDYYRALQ